MSGLIDKRKRSREDEFCDSTPLSKRINNLHLTNFEEAQNSMQNAKQRIVYNIAQALPSPSKQSFGVAVEGLPTSYHPELDESQNPFYYVKNKLLHELHLERLKRCTI